MLELKQVLVPVVLFLCVTYGFRVLVTAVTRVLVLRDGGSEDLIRAMSDGDRLARRQSSLHWGINLLALAAALASLDIAGIDPSRPAAIALVVAALGIANLVHYRLVRRLD